MTPGAFIDLHVHTRLGSLDSSLDPEVMVAAAMARGLSGVAITEHFRVWSPSEIKRHCRPGLTLYAGIEVTLDVGHILVFGVERAPRSRTLEELSAEVSDMGGALVLAHPFRGYFDPWQQESFRLDRWRVLSEAAEAGHVHAIETRNNGCGDRENALAARLACGAGLPGVAGSDAHTAKDVGHEATKLTESPRDSFELAALLRRLAERPRALFAVSGMGGHLQH